MASHRKKPTEEVSPQLAADLEQGNVPRPEDEDGPTHVPPIPPPPAVADPPKRRGRPPGSKTRPKADPVPVLDLEDVKKELAQLSALAVAFTRDEHNKPRGTLGEMADALGWHQHVVVIQDGRTIDAIAPSKQLEKAAGLMGPYLDKSGALQLVQLGPEVKFALGLGVLVGPAMLVGVAKLWHWAMHPKRAAAQVVPMAKAEG